MSFDSELKRLDEQGLRRSLIFRDKLNLVNFSLNDYLGLSQHPQVKQAAKEAIDEFGTGAGASRLLAGTLSLHQSLECELARFVGKPRALVYGSGYHTNTGILPALSSNRDVIFFDRLSHASIVDGIRLSSSRFFSFEHNNLDDLTHLLESKRVHYERAFIVTEGLFSMDGDCAPLKSLVALSKKWNALLMVDEAHSLGVVGPQGRGFTAEVGETDGVDIVVGTLSKTLGAQGGFVAASESVIDLLISKSRSFIYSTALSPANAAAALAALKLVPTLDDRRQLIHAASSHVFQQLTAGGYAVMASSLIMPIWTGSIEATKKLSDHLFSMGFFVPSVRPPTIPVGEGRVRLSMAYPSVSLGVEKLIDAFLTYPERPYKEGDRIAETR